MCEVADACTSTLVDREFCDILIIEEDMSFVRHYESHRHVEGGCLPCTVRAKEADDLPLSDMDRDVTDDRAGAVTLDKVLRAKYHAGESEDRARLLMSVATL